MLEGTPLSLFQAVPVRSVFSDSVRLFLLSPQKLHSHLLPREVVEGDVPQFLAHELLVFEELEIVVGKEVAEGVRDHVRESGEEDFPVSVLEGASLHGRNHHQLAQLRVQLPHHIDDVEQS